MLELHAKDVKKIASDNKTEEIFRARARHGEVALTVTEMRPSARGTDNAFQAVEWAADDKDGSHRGARRAARKKRKFLPARRNPISTSVRPACYYKPPITSAIPEKLAAVLSMLHECQSFERMDDRKK